jgi:hypothetical protein
MWISLMSPEPPLSPMPDQLIPVPDSPQPALAALFTMPAPPPPAVPPKPALPTLSRHLRHRLPTPAPSFSPTSPHQYQRLHHQLRRPSQRGGQISPSGICPFCTCNPPLYIKQIWTPGFGKVLLYECRMNLGMNVSMNVLYECI